MEPRDSALEWVAEHTRKYVETGGEDGYLWRGCPTLVLTTTGRTSGEPRRNALIFGRDGDDYVLVASYGGRPTHPMWYRNLVADPEVAIQVKSEVIHGRAATVENPEERRRLFEMMAAIYAPYNEYQAKTERIIPVVRVTAT